MESRSDYRLQLSLPTGKSQTLDDRRLVTVNTINLPVVMTGLPETNWAKIRQMRIHEIGMRMPILDDQSMLAWNKTIQISRSTLHLSPHSGVLKVVRALVLLTIQEPGLFDFKKKQQNEWTYEFGLMRPRRDDKVCEDCNGNSQNSFNDKDPSELFSMLSWRTANDIFYHCHPFRPPIPSILPIIYARIPPKAPASAAPPKKIATRQLRSCLYFPTSINCYFQEWLTRTSDSIRRTCRWCREKGQLR